MRIIIKNVSLCFSLTLSRMMAIAECNGTHVLPPPLITDLVAGHKRIQDFITSPGSTHINEDKVFGKLMIADALKTLRAIWIKGNYPKTALFEVITEKWLAAEYLADRVIGLFVPGNNKYL